MKGATLGEGDGPDVKGHGRDEGEHEKGESRRGFSSPNKLPFHDIHHWSPFASEVQDAFLGLV